MNNQHINLIDIQFMKIYRSLTELYKVIAVHRSALLKRKVIFETMVLQRRMGMETDILNQGT